MHIIRAFHSERQMQAENEYEVTYLIYIYIYIHWKGDELQILGKGVQQLVTAVRELRHLRVEDLDLLLPKIVVAGDQSIGKSLLVKDTSEINVPRSTAGTCTRCSFRIHPTENASHNARWSC